MKSESAFYYTYIKMKKFSISILCLLSLLILIKPTVERSFTQRNQRFYDKEGGQIIFHGINVVAKNFPYYKTDFGDKDLKMIKQWGLNAMRIGVMWPGVEPEEGKFNQSYLDVMVDLVNKAGKQYGIYTLIQYHQDLFAEDFCGDGAPSWAIDQDLKERFPSPIIPPDSNKVCEGRPWADFYFAWSINQAFYRLYQNKNGLLDKFVKYWKKVAQKFKGNKYVIGYQIMNEPWPGNLFKQIFVMIPGIAEKTHLQQFHDRVAEQIRSVDPEQNICMEPVTWNSGLNSGYNHAQGGAQFANTSQFCFHYYNPPTINMENFMNARKRDMDRLSVGGMLTQFWVLTENAQKDMVILDICDQMSISWFGWVYLNDIIPYVMKRTYAQRVSGIKSYQKFNTKTKQYQLIYKSKPKSGKTVIFFNYDHYQFGQVKLQKKKSDHRPPNPKFGKDLDKINMYVSISPTAPFTISEGMYIIIDSKNTGNKQINVKVSRKQL